jgi:hypothetical protein
MALVWVRIPNLPLRLWDLLSPQAIDNTLGKFHCKREETKKYNITTYARICVEMDRNKIDK